MIMKKEEVEKILHEKVEKGEHVSPILPKGIKNYLIDIDGNEEPEKRQPYSGMLKLET